jgi:hypothetical protein
MQTQDHGGDGPVRPVFIPRTASPRKTRAKDRPSEKAYSPAIVE